MTRSRALRGSYVGGEGCTTCRLKTQASPRTGRALHGHRRPRRSREPGVASGDPTSSGNQIRGSRGGDSASSAARVAKQISKSGRHRPLENKAGTSLSRTPDCRRCEYYRTGPKRPHRSQHSTVGSKVAPFSGQPSLATRQAATRLLGMAAIGAPSNAAPCVLPVGSSATRRKESSPDRAPRTLLTGPTGRRDCGGHMARRGGEGDNLVRGWGALGVSSGLLRPTRAILLQVENKGPIGDPAEHVRPLPTSLVAQPGEEERLIHRELHAAPPASH